MAVRYPSYFNIRLTQEDKHQLEKASMEAEVPASTLARKILRQWLRSTEINATTREKNRQLTYNG